MKGHIHTDAFHIAAIGTGTAIYFHLMRVIAGYIGTKFSPSAGQAIGGFFTFG